MIRVRLLMALTAVALANAPAATTAKTSSESCLLVVEETAGGLAILDREGALRTRLPLGERPHEIAVTRDGRTAYIPMFGIADYNNRLGTPGRSVVRVDLKTGKLSGRFDLPEGLRAPHGVQLRPSRERELFVNAEVGGDVMIVFDTTTGTVLRQFPIPAATHNFIFSRGGDSVFSFAGKYGVSRLDAKTGRVIAHADIGSPARGLRLLGSRELAVAGKGEVVILDIATLRILRRMKAPVDGQLAYLETLSDGRVVAPSLSDNGVVIFDKAGQARFVATGKTALVARAARDGRVYVANVLDDHLSIVDTNGATARRIGEVQGPNGIAFGACPQD